MLDVQKGQVNMKLNKIKLVILAAAMAVNTLGVTAIAAEPVEETTEQQIMPDIYESFGMEFGHFEDNRELDKYDYDPSDDILMTYVAEPFPLAEYPANTSYFNKNGTVPCTCHGGALGNYCDPGISCDCKVFEGSIQCVGFGRYVYKAYHSASLDDSGSTATDYGDNGLSLTKNNVRRYIMPLGVGTYIRVKYYDGRGHSMIVAKTDTSYVYLYHANWGSSCGVKYTRMPYDEFVTLFPKLNLVVE